MARTLFATATLALATSLSACAPMPPVAAVPPPAGQCHVEPARWAIGQAATADVVERIRIDTHSSVARVIRPGQAVTGDRCLLSREETERLLAGEVRVEDLFAAARRRDRGRLRALRWKNRFYGWTGLKARPKLLTANAAVLANSAQ